MNTTRNALLWFGQCAPGMVAMKRFTAVAVTDNGDKVSWVYDDMNIGHYDYYCWLITGLNLVNIVYYFMCCRAYGNDDYLPWGMVVCLKDDVLQMIIMAGLTRDMLLGTKP
ncbi:Protein NRT1/ PTR FAMILY 1.1 [Linum perenne]